MLLLLVFIGYFYIINFIIMVVGVVTVLFFATSIRTGLVRYLVCMCEVFTE